MKNIIISFLEDDLVSKKSFNLRDGWKKCTNKQIENKRSTFCCICHEHRKFLMKSMDFFIGHESIDEETNAEKIHQTGNAVGAGETIINEGVTRTSPRVERKQFDEVDVKTIKFSDELIDQRRKEDNRYVSFFNSILPSLTQFDDEQTLEFYAEVLSALRKIRQRKRRISGETIHLR